MYSFKNRADIELKCVLFRSGITPSFVQKCRKQDSFVYYLSGGHEFDFYDYKIKASAGELLYLPLGSSYSNRALSSNTEYYQIEFKIHDNNIPTALFDKPRVLSSDKDFKYVTIFAEAYNNYIKRTASSSSLCLGNILKIIGMITDEKDESTKLHGVNRIAPTLTYISEHYDLDTSVTDLAKISSTGVSNLEKIFKQCFGMSPAAYRNSIRIDCAKQLLSGGYTIEETARLTGFSDRYYFSKAFKTITGISPGQFIKAFEI